MWLDGYGVSDIFRDSQVNLTRRRIRRWVQRFRERHGKVPDEELVQDEPRSGRPSKVTPRVRRLILNRMEDRIEHRSLRETSTWLAERGVNVGKDAIGDALARENPPVRAYKRKKVPRLNTSQKKKRVKFARERKGHDWQKTLFTDEKDFELFAPSNPQNNRYWTRYPSRVPPRQLVRQGAKVSVWGGISSRRKTELLFYEGRLGAKEYQNILKEAKPSMERCFQRQNWTFLHDGASAHKAKSTNKWLSENVPDHITSGPTGEWPANSPDLNPIENIWGIMAGKLERDPPQTAAALKRRVTEAWEDIPVRTLKHIKGMPNRMKAVIEAKGESIGK